METTNSIAGLIGKIIGVVIVAALLTGIPAVVASLRGKPMSKQQTISVFVVACIIVVIASLVASSNR